MSKEKGVTQFAKDLIGFATDLKYEEDRLSGGPVPMEVDLVGKGAESSAGDHDVDWLNKGKLFALGRYIGKKNT